MIAIVYAVLFASALVASYLPIRETKAQPMNHYVLEVGSLFATILWGVVAFHSFDVVTVTSGVTTHHEYASLAIFALAAGLIMLAFTYKTILGTIVPQRSEAERQL